MQHASLKVASGKQAGSLISLPTGKFLIGREEDCHLRPNSDLVSRHHCVFTVDDYSVRIRDLGSTNGTFVNGERLRGGVVLKQGDAVSIGKIDFEVQITDASQETATHLSLNSDTSMSQPLLVPKAEEEPAPAITATISSDTLADFAASEIPAAVPAAVTGLDTQFVMPTANAPQPTLAYPQMPPQMHPQMQMGYPQMMPYGYPGYPQMYPQQMGYPQMQGMPGMGMYPQGYPQMPAAPMAAPVEEPVAVKSPVQDMAVKLPNPEDTGAKAPAPAPKVDGDNKPISAEARAKAEAPKRADDIIQQYLKRKPTIS